MIPYLLLLNSHVLIILVGRFFGVRNNTLLITILIITTVLFAGLRGNIGTDTFAYRDYYVKAGDEAQDVFFEPTFSLLSLLGKTVGLDPQFFIFSIALIQGFFIYLSVKLIKEKDLYYCLVLSTYYVSLNLNLIRVGLAIYIIGYALLLKEYGKPWRAKFLATFATLTHLSTIVAIPFFWKKFHYLLIPFILFTINNLDLIRVKVSGYILDGNLTTSDFKIGVGFLVTTTLILLCLHKEKLIIDRLLIGIFAASIAFKIAGFGFDIFDRVAIIFEFSFITLLLNRINFNQTRLILFVLIMYNIYKSVAFIENSDEAMEVLLLEYPGLNSLYGHTHWIPYEFFWESKP